MEPQSVEVGLDGVRQGGGWLAAVSGGSDSVGMLLMFREQVGWVVTVDHETRGGESTKDAGFVADLCGRLGVGCTVVRRSEIEQGMAARESEGDSEWYRKVRQVVYAREVEARELEGVMLAHHVEDQAETIWMRLLRGSGWEGLGGMEEHGVVGGVRVWRPLLGAGKRKGEIVVWLRERGETWREDASNQSGTYGRNRVRAAMTDEMVDALLELGESVRAYRGGLEAVCPPLGEEMGVGMFDGVIGRWIGRRWLSKWVVSEELSGKVVERFCQWVGDAAAGPRLELPGRVVVRRKRGKVWVEGRSK